MKSRTFLLKILIAVCEAYQKGVIVEREDTRHIIAYTRGDDAMCSKECQKKSNCVGGAWKGYVKRLDS